MFAARNMMFTRPGYDPDASALCAALITAGATVSAEQKTAIDTFIRAEKTASRWDLHKRLHMPVWGMAAANAICWKTRLSGTYYGGVTHAAGYTQGNGSTGYFLFDAANSALGLTESSGQITALIYDEDSRTDNRCAIGAQDGPFGGLIRESNTLMLATMYSASTGALFNTSARTGIFTAGLTSTTARYLKRRSSGGITTVASNTDLSTTSASRFPTAVMARNLGGSIDQAHNGKIGSAHIGLALSESDSDAFTLNLKDCWETITGLTLP